MLSVCLCVVLGIKFRTLHAVRNSTRPHVSLYKYWHNGPFYLATKSVWAIAPMKCVLMESALQNIREQHKGGRVILTNGVKGLGPWSRGPCTWQSISAAGVYDRGTGVLVDRNKGMLAPAWLLLSPPPLPLHSFGVSTP